MQLAPLVVSYGFGQISSASTSPNHSESTSAPEEWRLNRQTHEERPCQQTGELFQSILTQPCLGVIVVVEFREKHYQPNKQKLEKKIKLFWVCVRENCYFHYNKILHTEGRKGISSDLLIGRMNLLFHICFLFTIGCHKKNSQNTKQSCNLSMSNTCQIYFKRI